MKRKIMMSVITLLAAGIFAAAPVFAEDAGDGAKNDDLRMVGENETIDDVEKRIALPETASETAGQAREQGKEFGMERSREGRETAEEAREQRKEFGRERSREAREGELGERARERIMDRENMQDKMPDSPRGPRTDGQR